jgi:hypothetical protein
VSWTTESKNTAWDITLNLPSDFLGDIVLHVHTPDGRTLSRSTAGTLEGSSVRLPRAFLAGKRTLRFYME